MARQHRNYILFMIAAWLTFFPRTGAYAVGGTTTINQTNAQTVAEDLNRKASDQSMQNATTSAMKALMHFVNGEMPSAVSNGMNAYGKYRNSEDLDHMGDRNTLNQAMMGSLDGGSTPTSVKKTNTSFRRLDPSFLRKGEAAAIAAEFEKQSGMKREDFLKELSDVSEKKISRNDPQLMDKVFSRFETFASHIPNQEFRKKLLNGVNKVPTTVRNGLVGKAISKFAGFLSSGGDSAVSAPATGGAPTAVEPVKTDSTPPAKETTMAEGGGAPATNPGATATTTGGPVGEDGRAAMLGNVISAAMHTQDEEISIFAQVSRKYRALSPSLLGRH